MSNTSFRGFADYANSSGSTTAAVLAAARSKKSQPSTGADNKPKSLRPSPIYTGSDQRLIVLFRKIGQKRDATTKIRALDELCTVFSNDDYTRPEKIASLCHLVFLHETKLGYDNNPSVRAGSYKALVVTKSHVPKAWNGLFLGEDGEASAATTVGMAWGARYGDPSSEVVRYADEFVKQLYLDSKELLAATQMAVFKYFKSAMGCKRASALQDVINPVSSGSLYSGSENPVGGKDKKKGAKAAAAKADADAAVAESEREEMEERYERVMLSTLIGLGSLVESHPENDSKLYASVEDFPDAQSIVRLMQSSRTSFRRESYRLVGRCCQFAKSLVQPDESETSKIIPLATLMPNLIAAEKDSSNFVPLLELILSYLSMFRSKEATNETNSPWESMDASAFVKAISKALRRACCGAPATNWGQMVLPIVAFLPCDEDGGRPLPLVVVESLLEGRKSAVGAMDTAAIVSSVIECVTYLLLHRPKDTSSSFTEESWVACGQLFLDSLIYFLNEAPASGGSSIDKLCMTIARDLIRLDAASDDKMDDRGISQIKSFIWSDSGMQRAFLSAKRDRSTDTKLARLMANMMESQKQNNEHNLNHILPSVRALFNAIVVYSDSRGNKSCTKEEAELILNIINICEAQSLFPIHKTIETHDGVRQISLSLEEFCVNNLIRWILIHSQSAKSAVPTDFNIGKCLLLSIQSLHQQKQVWETILRELIKSYCDVSTLATGLSAMASDAAGNSCVDLIKCHTLDQFAIELSNQVMDDFWHSHDLSHPNDQDEATIRYQGDMFLFFKTCAGITDCKSMIVSASVIKHWVSCCYDESNYNKLTLEDEAGSNVLLETLLLIGSSSSNSVLSQDELALLITESWHEGGPIWKRTAVKNYNLTIKTSIRDEIMSRASSYLHERIRRKPSTDHSILELTSQSWSKKAARLLEISTHYGLETVGIDLDLCGVVDEQNAAESLFLHVMYLVHYIDCPDRCRELLLSSPNQDLFVRIQSSIAEPANTLLQSFQQRTQRNRQLIELLGGLSEFNDVAQNLTIKCVDLLACFMKDIQPGQSNGVSPSMLRCRRALTSLSYITSLLYDTKWTGKNSTDDCTLAEDINEGDCLWYEKADGKRVKSTVLKVHTDDFPNLYFTIKEEDSSEERQTISNRLKQNPTPPLVSLNEDDQNSREFMGRYMMDNLLKPFICKLDLHNDLSMQNELSAECINIIVSQIGLVSVGIGSVRYEIVQTIASIERSLQEIVSDSVQNLDKVSSLLCCMSLAMGYGLFTIAPPLGDNLVELKLSSDSTLAYLLDCFDEHNQLLKEKSTSSKLFHSSVAMWLSATLIQIQDGDTLRRVSGMLIVLCDILLPGVNGDSSILLMKAVLSFQTVSKKCIDYSSADSDSEVQLFERITKCFIDTPEATDMWIDTYAAVLRHYMNEVPRILIHTANLFSDNLFECLESPSKRWCAFQMLMVHAKKHRPTTSSEDVIFSSESESLLSLWKKELDEEEAEELENDVRITSLWLSEAMLIFIQRLRQRSNFRTDSNNGDHLIMGDLLGWLVFLEIFDNAGAADMRNRSSMCVFLQKTNAVGALMGLALKEANLDVRRKENIFECISSDTYGEFVLRNVATLAVFRTIESIPTLAKTWYNDDCPRFLQQKLMAFVENKVAPETLQRELIRIKDATSFGEMTVNGSAVSREVIAIYHQDECQLSVTIRIPPAFPLRNVEVDLGKTLGIAEKRWRRWSLNIMMMLNNQDGSILDALLLWKENVDKEFEGVEPCPVCYSVLCIKTHSMPNLKCKTCNNCFHSLCLHKWFQSSGKSNCVLCQQPWSGTKVI